MCIENDLWVHSSVDKATNSRNMNRSVKIGVLTRAQHFSCEEHYSTEQMRLATHTGQLHFKAKHWKMGSSHRDIHSRTNYHFGISNSMKTFVKFEKMLIGYFNRSFNILINVLMFWCFSYVAYIRAKFLFCELN